jgi:hypothetical protein
MDPNVITLLLTNVVIKRVFDEVVKKRRVQLKDLRESVGSVDLGGTPEEGTVEPIVQAQIEDAVQKLKSAKLIEERQAPIKDFNTYYVTASGLNAERELRLAAAM